MKSRLADVNRYGDDKSLIVARRARLIYQSDDGIDHIFAFHRAAEAEGALDDEGEEEKAKDEEAETMWKTEHKETEE